MTIRRFNYTGCKRIAQRDVSVAVTSEGEVNQASVIANLSTYDLPTGAPVVFEAFADWTLMRFAMGTAGIPKTEGKFVLSEFDSPEGISFRLKVLGAAEQEGLILAEADRLSPVPSDIAREAHSFVRVRPTDLGAVGWQLVFDDSGPLLQVNDRLEDWRAFCAALHCAGSSCRRYFEDCSAALLSSGQMTSQRCPGPTNA